MGKKATEEVRHKLKKKGSAEELDNKPTPEEMLSSGSTMLNLGVTGTRDGCFAKGKYIFIVGDSASGKTFLGLTCLAEAVINKYFDDYDLVYNNSEDGALMDIETYFGSGVAKRIQFRASETIEEFYDDLDDQIKTRRPFIYIMDSMDSLSSMAEGEKLDEQKKARRAGKDASGSYGDGKAKINSANLRRVVGKLKKTGSILIILNQTRDNLGFGFEKKTRSGGHALRFYAALEIWSSVVGKLDKTIKGKKRELGIITRIKIKKNRFTGKLQTVTVPIYHSFKGGGGGIDDVGSMVDFLLEEKYWVAVGKAKIITPDEYEDFEGNRDKLIRYIETNDLEEDLREIVEGVWQGIEDACSVKRKNRYG